MKTMSIILTLAVGLSGCQTLEPRPAPPSVMAAEGQLWLAQAHWEHARQRLDMLARQTQDPGLWRDLGAAHWRLGIEAMATAAALDPTQAGLEDLGEQVFQLEAYLNEQQTRVGVSRNPGFITPSGEPAVGRVADVPDEPAVWRVD